MKTQKTMQGISEQHVSASETRARKSYSRPELTKLGKISDVTLAGTGSKLENKPGQGSSSKRAS